MSRIQGLFEQCVVCGLVHRDDLYRDRRLQKVHFHWVPLGGEVVIKNYLIHATVCAEHVPGVSVWQSFSNGLRVTPAMYQTGAFNARAPDIDYFRDHFDGLYHEQVGVLRAVFSKHRNPYGQENES